MKYAIIKTGGKQIKVHTGFSILVEKLELEEGKTYTFKEVLAVYDEKTLTIGKPLVAKATVKATVQKQGKGKKIKILRTRAKSNWARHQGHRQPYTRLIIEEIILDGKTIEKFVAVKVEKQIKIEKPQTKSKTGIKAVAAKDISAQPTGVVTSSDSNTTSKSTTATKSKTGVKPVVAKDISTTAPVKTAAKAPVAKKPVAKTTTKPAAKTTATKTTTKKVEK